MVAQANKYLRDEDGDVTLCTRNIAKMNLFEWVWHGREIILDAFIEMITAVLKGIIALIALIIFPILVVANGYTEIRNDKRKMKEMNK